MRQAGIVTLRDLKRKLLRDDDLTGDVKSHSHLITKSHKNVIDKAGKAGRKKRFK